jgi:hypothetical protein
MSWSIALVTHQYPPQTGGVETHANRLADRGHEVTVIAADSGETVTAASDTTALTCAECGRLPPTDQNHLALGVLTTLAGLNPGLVHAHNYHSFPMAISALSLAVRRASTPLVVTPHHHGTSDNSLREQLLSLYASVGGHSDGRQQSSLSASGSVDSSDRTSMSGTGDPRRSGYRPVSDSYPRVTRTAVSADSRPSR